MDKVKQAQKKFNSVVSYLRDAGLLRAHRLAYKKPLTFYLEHGKMEAIQILRKEAGNE